MNELKILYTDDHITVCVKPPLMLSQENSNGSNDMLCALYEQTNEKHKPVHRLDFGVGGVMVYAKTDKASSVLCESVRNNSFEKEYLAVVWGKPEDERGIYEDLLFKDSSKNKSYVVNRMRKGVKHARLEYKTLDTKCFKDNKLSLILIKLHTGRTHQIRVQFASRKTALYGDGKYGSRITDKKIALWSYRICFTHPITKKQMIFSCLPDRIEPWNLFDVLKSEQLKDI